MLLDSNVLIIAATRSHEHHVAVREFLRGREGLYVSAITKPELLGWAGATPGDLALRSAIYESTRSLTVGDSVLDRAASLRRRRQGMKTPDAIVAATALLYDLVLVTCNVRDFVWIEELDVIDPANPALEGSG